MPVANGYQISADGSLSIPNFGKQKAPGVAGRTLVARRTGQHLVPDVATHPASVATFGWLVAESWRRKRAGRLTWRGRPLP